MLFVTAGVAERLVEHASLHFLQRGSRWGSPRVPPRRLQALADGVGQVADVEHPRRARRKCFAAPSCCARPGSSTNQREPRVS